MAVDIKEEEHFAQVIVPDDQLSLAIGKSGQNARLAARLTGWKIDIKSETQFREMLINLQNETQTEEENNEIASKEIEEAEKLIEEAEKEQEIEENVEEIKEEKPKRTRKKKEEVDSNEEKVEEAEEKPKRTRKKKEETAEE